jgi:hypothetical protein
MALFIAYGWKNKEETACLQILSFEPHVKHGVAAKQSMGKVFKRNRQNFLYY